MAAHRTFDQDRAIAASGACLQANTRNPFDGLRKETGQDKLAPKVEDSTMRELVSAWDRFAETCRSKGFRCDDIKAYGIAKQRARSIRYTAEDVTRFSRGMTGIEGIEVFMSALVNEGSDQNYELFLDGNTQRRHTGLYNVKNLTIHGNVGRFCGRGMKSGSLNVVDKQFVHLEGIIGGRVVGNVDILQVTSKKANIEVSGNVGRLWVRGGTVTVNGSVDKIDAEKRAKIVVNGSVKEISRCPKGVEIYVNGNIGRPIGEIESVGKIYGVRTNTMRGGRIHVTGKFKIASYLLRREIGPQIFHNDRLVFGKEAEGGEDDAS